jgi:tetratricopeptide (TPR) repeat protein
MRAAIVALIAMSGLVQAARTLDPEPTETLEYLERAWADLEADEEAATYRMLGRLVASIDCPENALVYFDRAVAIHQDQIRDQPKAEDRWLAMADTLHAKARALLYLERPRLTEARMTCQQSIALAHKTIEKIRPGERDARSLLADAEMTLAEIEIARGDFAAAKVALEDIGRRKPVAAFMRQCLDQARRRTQRLSPPPAAADEFLEWIKHSLPAKSEGKASEKDSSKDKWAARHFAKPSPIPS